MSFSTKYFSARIINNSNFFWNKRPSQWRILRVASPCLTPKEKDGCRRVVERIDEQASGYSDGGSDSGSGPKAAIIWKIIFCLSRAGQKTSCRRPCLLKNPMPFFLSCDFSSPLFYTYYDAHLVVGILSVSCNEKT